MPSRADTQPFALVPLHATGAAKADGAAHWVGRSGAGLFAGSAAEALRDRARRLHSLSPLVPAEGVLRSALRRQPAAPAVQVGLGTQLAALVLLAEQTVSVATVGGAAAWVLRGDGIVAATQRRGGSLAVAVRPGDAVVLALDGAAVREEDLVRAASAGPAGVQDGQPSLSVRCVLAEASEFCPPLGDSAPHPSWAQTIFNEYGTHRNKL